MRLKYLLILAIKIILLSAVIAQEVSTDVLGIWEIYEEKDACGQVINDSEVLELVIIDEGSDMNLDTISLILKKNSGMSDTSLAILKIDSSYPEWIRVEPLIGEIAPGWQNLELNNNDSLAFMWLEACNACFCGGTYSMVKSPLVNIENAGNEKLSVWKVYPNPAKEKIYISSEPDYFNDRIKMVLIDLRGKVVKELELKERPAVLWLNELSGGMYYLMIYENSELTVKKILKL